MHAPTQTHIHKNKGNDRKYHEQQKQREQRQKNHKQISSGKTTAETEIALSNMCINQSNGGKSKIVISAATTITTQKKHGHLGSPKLQYE
jgi:hypothetical protein